MELPGRNDPCWCGSGKKFKKCHLGRGAEAPLSLGHFRKLLADEHRAGTCLHPAASPQTCTKVISAHTIQRSATLAALVDERNHVESFYPLQWDSSGQLVAKKIGWRNASTFRAFCSRHDDVTFAPLEKRAFDGSEEQVFLLAYRALCHELYQKTASDRNQAVMRENLDRGMTPEDQRQIQAYSAVFGAGVAKGKEDAEYHKGIFDSMLMRRDFSKLSTAIVWFRGELSVGSTGAPTPTFDLDGQRLQDLADLSAQVEPLYLSTVATDGGGAVALSWLSGASAPSRFVHSLLAREPSQLPSLLVQYIFLHLENTYFATRWWASLGEQARTAVKRWAGITNPYYDQPIPTTHELVNWQVTAIQRLNST